MTSAGVWSVIALLAVIVVFQRSAFLLLPARLHPRGQLLRALAFAPVAALIAICVPEIFQGALGTPSDPWAWVSDGRVLSALVVLAAMRMRLNALWCLALAGAVLWVF
jgi:branched-subunit amino acid transport protein